MLERYMVHGWRRLPNRPLARPPDAGGEPWCEKAQGECTSIRPSQIFLDIYP